MENKTIGIITFHRADNFGAVLQNYALQQAIYKLGYKCETIDYISKNIEDFYSLDNLNNKISIKKKIENTINKKSKKISHEKFESFRKNFLYISSKQYTSDTIKEANYQLYICGSDQIWNREIIGPEDVVTYTLNFTNMKKAAYSASCGSNNYLINDG